MAGEYRFSFGPWNIHGGADPFGPPVRTSIEFAEKLPMYKQLGFDAVQFHDDDAVPNLEDLPPHQIRKEAAEIKKTLDGEGLVAEFVAPRLWEDPRGIDGGFTSNDPAWSRTRSNMSVTCCTSATSARMGTTRSDSMPASAHQVSIASRWVSPSAAG